MSKHPPNGTVNTNMNSSEPSFVDLAAMSCAGSPIHGNPSGDSGLGERHGEDIKNSGVSTSVS